MTATPDLASKPSAGARRQMLAELWFYFRQNRGAVIGLWVTIALVVVALAAPLLAPHSSSMQFRVSSWAPMPSAATSFRD
jgi:dipeptide transport system permease protein